MNRYLKGAIASLTVHLVVIAAVFVLMTDGAPPSREMLVVDFSTVAWGPPDAGGDPEITSGDMPETQGLETRKNTRNNSRRPEGKPRAESGVKTASALSARPSPDNTPVTSAGEGETEKAGTPAQGADEGKDSNGGNPEAGMGQGNRTGSGSEEGEGLARSYVRHNYSYILLHIRKHLAYPSQARRVGITGTVTCQFVIKKDGHIDALRIKTSSGHELLDEAALKAIQRASPFPAPPVPARISMPIVFSLR
ncbi:TonB family protein [Oxalobacter vibrioformis]|uniref:TonB family protein n=1 Tax=Oxalobacter vibrioformis TaxID=933080 RepID=A0A9E9LZ03_9BURK|nr:TonB family protein [Oxalobacter vibrioformis]WAW10119.1 TonB family protein [Oxalobacter vibrioformis]